MKRCRKIVIAPDSYKGCLPASGVAECVRKGFAGVFPDAEYRLLPLADGGEGTLDALLRVPGAKCRQVAAHDAFMRPVSVGIGELPGGVFVVELAGICGLERHIGEFSPLKATTFGFGEAIRAAAAMGAKQVIAAIGGSVSTDGGAGLAQGMGAVFMNARGERLPDGLGGGDLNCVASADLSGLVRTAIVIASDVTSPLCGERGAASVFAPQKGATPAEVELLDANLRKFAAVFGETGRTAGDGAAGGAGFGLRYFGGGAARSGAEVVFELLDFRRQLENADLVVTGEGRSDAQTLAGKLCLKVREAAGDVPVVLLSGAVSDREKLAEKFSEIVAATPPGVPLPEALANAPRYIEAAAGRVARELSSRRDGA